MDVADDLGDKGEWMYVYMELAHTTITRWVRSINTSEFQKNGGAGLQLRHANARTEPRSVGQSAAPEQLF
jgi:hypothetical protein